MIDRSLLRLACLAIAIALAGSVAQAQTQPPPPPVLEPLPEVAPAPTDPDLEPQVTIIRREDEVVEEVRVGGELKYIRVTPRHGRPYFLIPNAGGQTFLRRDSFDSGLRVPQWVWFSW